MAPCLWLAATLVARAADEAPVVDVTRVFVFANAETIAMGGAGSAFAFGANGIALNPAAPGNRRKEVTGALFTSALAAATRTAGQRDFWNLGEDFDGTGTVYNLAGAAGYRGTAAGVMLGGAWYQLPDSFTGTTEAHADLAHVFAGGRVAVGAGARLLGVRNVVDGERADYFGAGAEVGAIFPNIGEHWNFAVALRSGVHADTHSTLDVPFDGASLPPQAAIGVGWSTGSDASVPVRLAADLVVDGAVEDAVSLEKLLVGEVVPRGENASISPRGGAEVEVWRDRLRLRGGGYLEAARTDLAASRPHATGGFELHLLELRAMDKRVKFDLAWQVGVDYAPRYLRFLFFGINVWGSGAVGGVYTPQASVE